MLRRESGSGGESRCGVAFAAFARFAALALISAGMPASAAEDAVSASRAVAQGPDSRNAPGDESYGSNNVIVESYAPEQEGVTSSSQEQIRIFTAGPVWDQELRRNAMIQARLRNEAGDRVFFSAGSAELGGRARAALSAQAVWLNRWHEFEAAIEGYADDPGSEAENVALAARRAEAVRRRLVEEGVAAARLAIVAQGRARRVATCTDPSCAAQNRRALTRVFASGTLERLHRASGPIAEALEQSPTRGQHLPAAAGGTGLAR